MVFGLLNLRCLMTIEVISLNHSNRLNSTKTLVIMLISYSYGVLRGLHYQEGNTAQAKLVRVIKGKVVDVAVDLRKSSPTFGKYVMVELSEDNKRQFFVPRGFAHGFLVLSDEAIFTYKVDNVYSPQTEASLRWNDETVAVKWPIDAKDVILSDKDLNKGLSLKDAKVFE